MRALTLVLALLASPALSEVPRVVTDIAPVQSLTALVMGDLGAPQVLLDGATDPHSFQMRPSQARALAGADVVIWMGPALVPWLDDTLQTLAPDAQSLALLDGADAPLRIADHGPLDPHAWLDPLNGAYYLNLIAQTLAQADSPNAETYAANANSAVQRLRDLDAHLQTRLAPLRGTPLIAGHDAYSYFLKRYDLHLTGALSDSAGTAPGAARISDLRDAMGGVTGGCLLVEPGANTDLIRSLDAKAPLTIVEIDDLGRALPPGPDLYETLIGAVADALETCVAR